MRKILATILLIVLAMTIVGCAKKTVDKPSRDTTTVVIEEDGETVASDDLDADLAEIDTLDEDLDISDLDSLDQDLADI